MMAPPTYPDLPSPVVARKLHELHPAFYVVCWIFFSNATIIFNKWLLDTAAFPIILTTIHLLTATILTRILARTTNLLASRHTNRLTGRLYLRAVLPIGLLYSLSLVFSNQAYLSLSVPFIQMLKAASPVTTLLLSWGWGLSNPKVSVLYNVLVIAVGVLMSSVGEVRFNWLGFCYQMGGSVTESMRLILIQMLLAGEEMRMDPLVGLYYYAPVCALLNGVVAVVAEVPRFDYADLRRVGAGMLLSSGLVAFALNVASVFLIGKTSALAMNLTGILKSILLVAVSMVIWQTQITLLQAVGYAVALVGMFYYSMGPEAARGHVQTCRAWLATHARPRPRPRPLHDLSWSDLRSRVRTRLSAEPLRGLRSLLAAPWGDYALPPSPELAAPDRAGLPRPGGALLEKEEEEET